jgi:CRP-like cAMP-binding protein/Fe-S-cluster-containing hydrogenase component 2
MFAGLSPEVLNTIRPHVFALAYARGDVILREGEYCDGAYCLVAGEVDLQFNAPPAPAAAAPRRRIASFGERLRALVAPARTALKPSGGESIVLADAPLPMRVGERATLGPGEIFGEGSALSRYPIATTISARSDVRALLIRTPALRLMIDQPELASFKAFFETRYRERALRAHLNRVPLFRALPEAALEELVAAAELVTFKPNRVIATEGEPTDSFFLVRAGYIKMSTRVGGGDLAVTYLRKGDWAGEAGLLLDEPWPATLTALEHVELVKLTREQIDAVRRRTPGLDRELWQTLVTRLKQSAAARRNPLGSTTMQFAMDSGLIHGESVLLIDLETCTRCDECVRACADVHDGIPRFVREGIKFRNFSVPTACYQCTDPVCMIGCPTGAITRPLGTLEVTIDRATCIGCGNCVARCPWGNIQSIAYDSPTLGRRINLASKCDLCVDRAAGPACVQMCPHGSAMRLDFKRHEVVEQLLSR